MIELILLNMLFNQAKCRLERQNMFLIIELIIIKSIKSQMIQVKMVYKRNKITRQTFFNWGVASEKISDSSREMKGFYTCSLLLETVKLKETRL